MLHKEKTCVDTVVLMILVVGSLCVTSVQTVFVRSSRSLIQEEAIEISRNTPIVLEGHMKAGYPWEDYRIARPYEVGYWSATYIKALKEKFSDPRNMPDEWRLLPDDHGVWRINWTILGSGYIIVHFIDEFTGEIVSDVIYTWAD